MAETRAFEAYTGKLPTCIFRHWHLKRDPRREATPNRKRRGGRTRPPGHPGKRKRCHLPTLPSVHKAVHECTGFLAAFRSGCGAVRRRQRAGGGVGPARVTTPPGRGKKPYPSLGDLIIARSHCHTGRRNGAGTRAIRSHVPRKASQNQRLPATPPSTRLSHNKL